MRTRIKICGLTREQDVLDAVEVGADAIGLVFYRASPRFVSIEVAKNLIRRIPAFVTAVGLFVNEDAGVIRETLAEIPLGLLQFHGDEEATFCESFSRPYMKAARVKAGFDLINYAARYPTASSLLVDAWVDGYGGGGQQFDWSLIPERRPVPLVLAGGLNPGNITEAVRLVRPWAVDVSSGVESTKGIKDRKLMDAFVAGVREADV